MLREERCTVPFVVPEDAADLLWIKAILAKEVEHASKPEGPGMGLSLIHI